jgi:hypothetical protein
MNDFVMPGSGGLREPQFLRFIPNTLSGKEAVQLPLGLTFLASTTVNFSNVLAPGTTSALSIDPQGLLPENARGITLFGAADLFTSALHSGAIDVAFQYDPSLLPRGFDESQLHLFEFPNGFGTTPEDVTLGVNTERHLIFGRTDSLAQFAIGTAPVPEPGSLTLLGIGTAGLIGYAWRRCRRSVRLEKSTA